MATADIADADLDDDEVRPARPPHDPEPPRRRMTLAEFNALPEDYGVERMLIRGELWEKPVTKRNRRHARIEIRIGHLLEAWAESQPTQPGEVFGGEAGVDFPGFETGFGIDVAYFSAESLAGQSEDDRFLTGPPTLAVEILSPSDRMSEIWAKLDDYLAAGVKLVWVVDPHVRTVTVYRPDARPVLLAGDDELSGDPHLPGFKVPVAKVFSR